MTPSRPPAQTLGPLLLKISGEALKGSADGVFDPVVLARVGAEIAAAVADGEAVAVVVGGGNIVRGRDLEGLLPEPGRADDIGMLSTLINALAVRGAIVAAGGTAEVIAPQAISNVCRAQDRGLVRELLAAGTVVVFGGGTGQPFFTTDTAAALRAAEIGARCLLKGSQVDGIYSADPRHNPSATRYDRLTYDQAIEQRLAVMDTAAFALCRERKVPIRVFDMSPPGAIRAALGDNPPGTLVDEGASA